MFSDYLKQLRARGKRYFTLEQAVHDLQASRESILSAIYRMRKHNELISPARGLYVLIAPEHYALGCLPAEELVPILMKYWNIPYYVSLLTAAMYHGATHQKAGAFQIILFKRHKSLQLGKIRLDFIYKRSMKNIPLQNVTVNTGYLKIASPELTAMDLLLYPEKSGGLNHIATVLTELVESMQPDKLCQLAEDSNEKAWIQRLGYILEKIEPIDNIETYLMMINKLAVYVANKCHRFIPLASEISIKGASRCKKWMIIENTDIESDL